MPGFKRILVAIDGSKSAANAADAAVSIAKSSGASLFALSVVQNPVLTQVPAAGVVVPTSMSDYLDLAKQGAERAVAQVEEKAKTAGVKVRGEVVENVPSVVQAIIESADEWQVDLIVVGTRGLGSFKKLVIGSVSSGLVSHASCSVLVVR